MSYKVPLAQNENQRSLRPRVGGRVVAPDALKASQENVNIQNVKMSAAAQQAAQRRRVLGDISNNSQVALPQQDAAKKKVVVPNKPVADIEMNEDDMHEEAQAAALPAQAPAAPVAAPAASSIPSLPSIANPGFAIRAPVQDVEMMSAEEEMKDEKRHEAKEQPRAPEGDLYVFFKQIQVDRNPSCRYMSKQTDINAKMRLILINWLVEVHRKFRLRPETLFLTVNILDRFLERKAVSRTKLQLVGVGALLIASKYEEIYAPEVNELVEMTDNAYTRDEVLQVECIMLNALQFDLCVPTTHYFAQRILQSAEQSEELQHLTFFLLELCLLDYKMLKWLPSQIAGAAVYLARRMLGQHNWPAQLQNACEMSDGDVYAVAIDINHNVINPDQKEEAVRKKYSSSKFKCVSKTAPCQL